MNFAYADPPYLGRADFYRTHHPEALTQRERARKGELFLGRKPREFARWVFALPRGART